MEVVKFGYIHGKKVRGFVSIEQDQIKAVLIVSDVVSSIRSRAAESREQAIEFIDEFFAELEAELEIK